MRGHADANDGSAVRMYLHAWKLRLELQRPRAARDGPWPDVLDLKTEGKSLSRTRLTAHADPFAGLLGQAQPVRAAPQPNETEAEPREFARASLVPYAMRSGGPELLVSLQAKRPERGFWVTGFNVSVGRV
jgi:hypothetical protein